MLATSLIAALTGASPAGACEGPAELHAALLEHDKSRIAFQYKMQTGFVRRAGKGDIAIAADRNRHLYGGPIATLAAIQAHLRALDADGRTYALVLDPRPDSGCVWLIGARDLHADRRTLRNPAEDRDVTVSGRFRQWLDVEIRTMPRMAKPRKPQRIVQLPLPRLTAEEKRAFEPANLRREIIPDTLQDVIQRAAETVLVLPIGDVGAVPFSALPAAREGKALIDYVETIVLPSVDGLFFWVQLAPFRDFRNALIIGDPDLSNDADHSFIPLPSARSEAEAIASLTGGRALVGEQATYERIKRGLAASPQLIYFATHGIANAVDPMDGSFLALQGSHLRGAEIKALTYHSKHPLVVMSACQSGLGKTFNAGIFGLARAWIHAGAAQVLASQWNVDDEATAALMTAFMTGMSRGAPSAKALRQAMLETRTRYPDPALWGSFNLIGYPQPRL